MRSLSFIIAILFPISAFAFPVGEERSLDDFSEILQVQPRADFDFNGIIALSNCSGSVIHFAGQPKDSKAYVLTNGHCTGGFFGGFPKPGEVDYKQKSFRSFNAFVNVNKKVKVNATELTYATMTDTDAALYRLQQTYTQLEAKGVYSFELAAEKATVEQDIHIVSGYWKEGFECSIENFIYELHEGDYVMKDSIRYSDPGCEVYGGTSGSPVIAKGERLVIGVNNTGNEDGKKCTMNNPCEVTPAGDISIIKGRGYAQQTYQFYSCIDENYDLDLSIEGCLLPKP